MDNQPIELQLTEFRESSRNTSLFPRGLTNEDYLAYFASPIGESIRTHVSVVVRADTAVSKALGRAQRFDRLRVRGTARVISNPGALAIVVDSVESIETAGSPAA